MHPFVSTLATLAATIALFGNQIAEACTRAVYFGAEDRILTGRTLIGKMKLLVISGSFLAVWSALG